MRLPGPRRRGSAGLEAALALPIMLILFGAVSQVLITAQSRLHLEQAAHAAARSAMVHLCPPFDFVDRLNSGIVGLRPTQCDLDGNRLDALAQRKAEDAARWALVAAAPTTGAAAGRGCPDVPREAIEALTGSDMVAGRTTAVENALCYVYEPGNVTVELEWQRSAFSLVGGQTDVPIRATVGFRFPLSTPFRRFVRDGERGDGTYWKYAEASVTLL